ncbi:hypothetical protein ACIHAR_05710 [Streptomyces sp. NPDC052016]|jgi:predicted AlkP superfamily phosphohydrolase/phosphomutase
MPHLLTSILTRAAVGLLETAVMHLSVLLWKSLVTGGRPAAAHA